MGQNGSTADFNGEFRLRNRQYCYQLTITDFASRYLLTCEAAEDPKCQVMRRGIRSTYLGEAPGDLSLENPDAVAQTRNVASATTTGKKGGKAAED